MANKIRLGIVGAGGATWASRAHFPALAHSPDFELTAVCTTKPESAEAARQKHGAKLGFHDFRQMVASPEIDAVAVVVRVPSHYEPTKAALEAGKHVYTEWPLGRTTAEGVELAALAKAKGVRTAVGLQSRVSPPLMYMKEQIESGALGEITACRVSLMRDGVLERTASRTWQRDITLGANTLTIANGHTIDALRFVAGNFKRLTCRITTQVPQWYETDTKRYVNVTSPDNVLVSGQLASGAVASVHVAAIPWAGSGYRMEVYGRKGTLVATGEDSPQLCTVSLFGASGGNELTPVEIPQRFIVAPPGTPPVAPYNVGQMYSEFARAIRGEQGRQPTFDTAVDLHHFVDALRNASDTGREVEV